MQEAQAGHIQALTAQLSKAHKRLTKETDAREGIEDRLDAARHDLLVSQHGQLHAVVSHIMLCFWTWSSSVPPSRWSDLRLLSSDESVQEEQGARRRAEEAFAAQAGSYEAELTSLRTQLQVTSLTRCKWSQHRSNAQHVRPIRHTCQAAVSRTANCFLSMHASPDTISLASGGSSQQTARRSRGTG